MAGALVAGGALAGCGTPPSSPFLPSSAAPSASAGCVGNQTARNIWSTVNERLDAVQLDPAHQGADQVATGAALAEIQQYLQTTLTDKHLVEREKDRLDNLTVVDPGCAGGSLRVHVTATLVQDDYVKPDGSVDHRDTAVGSQLDYLVTFVRVNGTWKESDVSSLNRPSASGQVI